MSSEVIALLTFADCYVYLRLLLGANLQGGKSVSKQQITYFVMVGLRLDWQKSELTDSIYYFL